MTRGGRRFRRRPESAYDLGIDLIDDGIAEPLGAHRSHATTRGLWDSGVGGGDATWARIASITATAGPSRRAADRRLRLAGDDPSGDVGGLEVEAALVRDAGSSYRSDSPVRVVTVNPPG